MYKTPAETCTFFEKFRPLIAGSTHCEIVICPPFVDLGVALESVTGSVIEIGGQNLFWAKEGAYTGEVSGPMLKAIGCRWVLVAHSERRQFFGETNETASKKILAALEAGLTPIYCVGETEEERDGGLTAAILSAQIETLAGDPPEEPLVVAYVTKKIAEKAKIPGRKWL